MGVEQNEGSRMLQHNITLADTKLCRELREAALVRDVAR
jgi:hypothetical protein